MRGFDRRSRARAQEVRVRLRRHGVEASDMPAPVLVTHVDRADHDHVCGFLDVSCTGDELERVAGRTRTPLVRLRSTEQPIAADESHLAIMRAEWDAVPGSAGRAYPSALGRVPDTALETFRVVPDQPETGELTLRVADVGVRYLEPGAAVTMRCLSGGILVEAHGLSSGPTATWLARIVHVGQRAGTHRLFRDGLSTADLATGIRIRHDDDALVVHRV